MVHEQPVKPLPVCIKVARLVRKLTAYQKTTCDLRIVRTRQSQTKEQTEDGTNIIWRAPKHDIFNSRWSSAFRRLLRLPLVTESPQKSQFSALKMLLASCHQQRNVVDNSDSPTDEYFSSLQIMHSTSRQRLLLYIELEQN